MFSPVVILQATTQLEVACLVKREHSLIAY